MSRKPPLAWKVSTAESPVAICRAICHKFPDVSTKVLVAKCVAKGVAKNTAKVQVSRLKNSES